MKQWLFAALVLGTLAACTKTKIVEQIVEVEKKYAWTEIKDLAISFSNRAILGAFNFNDSTIGLVNQQGIFAFNARTLQFNNQLGGISGMGSAAIGHQRLANNQIAVTVAETFINISPTSHLTLSGAGAGIQPLLQGDSQFIRFHAPFIRSAQTIEQVGNRYLLVPFLAKSTTQKKAFAYLVPITRKQLDNLPRLETSTPKTIEFLSAFNGRLSIQPYSLFSHGSHFYISFGDDTYRVDTLGNLKAYGAPMYSTSGMFRLGNFLFAVNPNGRLYSSNNEGNSFSLFADLNNTLWGFLSFAQVGSETIAFYRDQLWLLALEGNVLQIRELQNEGLERSTITGIFACADKIFVTTHFGTFYRTANGFKTFKP